MDKKTLEEKKRRRISNSHIIVSVLLYIWLSLMLRKTVSMEASSVVMGFEWDVSILRGVITQLQMLLAVNMVLNCQRFTIYLAIFLNLYGVVFALMFAYVNRTGVSLPGAISYVGVILICILINHFMKKQSEQSVILLKQFEEIKKKERELRQMAYFDSLTKMFNRKMFIEELDIQLELRKKTKENFYVVFIDIDNFKAINDTMGHGVGDQVLLELAERIRGVVHEEDIVGRIGGDEMGMIILRHLDQQEVAAYLERIRSAIIVPFFINNNSFVVTASFGVSKYPDSGEDSKGLLSKADIAMYLSKKEGKNQILFYEDQQEDDLEEKQKYNQSDQHDFLEV